MTTSTNVVVHDDEEHGLQARRLGIHTQQEMLVFMRADCPVCRSEGLSARSQVRIKAAKQEIFATLYPVSTEFLGIHEVGLSEAAWRGLEVAEGDPLAVHHAESVESLSKVRHRIYGHRLDREALGQVMSDIVAGRFSDVHLAAFVTACASIPLDERETIDLTRAMVNVGERLSWPGGLIVDKHSVGGLPGNRTTPIVVAIVASHCIATIWMRERVNQGENVAGLELKGGRSLTGGTSPAT